MKSAEENFIHTVGDGLHAVFLAVRQDGLFGDVIANHETHGESRGHEKKNENLMGFSMPPAGTGSIPSQPRAGL